jgi:prefoldin subunit 5
MSLDFTYWPRIPRDKRIAYRGVETAIRHLQRHMETLTFAQAQADDKLAELAERLIDFGTALEAAQKVLSENAPEL